MTPIYIPNNLKLDDLIINYPPNFNINIGYYLLSQLTEMKVFTKRRYSDFIPLNSTFVQSLGVRDFPVYREVFIEYNVIECDGYYVPGNKSYKFKFSNQFQKPVKVILVNDKKIERNYQKRRKNYLTGISKYPMLYSWIQGLTIDRENAIDFIIDKYSLTSNADKFSANLVSIDKIYRENFFFNVDEKVGRLHTNLTNLNSELRNFLSYEGQSLVSIDLKNSQPFLLSALLSESFWQEKSSNEGHISFLSFSSLLSSSKTSLPPLMLAKIKKLTDNQDLKRFKKLVSNGLIYEYISEQLKQKIIVGFEDELPRKKIKEIVFTMLFTDNRFIGQKEAQSKRVFRELFPSVYELIKILQRNNKKRLPLLLQSIESQLILNVIAKRIQQERPNLPIFTIHDSIVTVKGNENYVAKVIIDEATKCIGSKPSLSIEHWNTKTK